MSDADLREVLEYALGGSAPPGFLNHLLRYRCQWDTEFRRQLAQYARELRPDLIIWEITVDSEGQLREAQVPLVPDKRR